MASDEPSFPAFEAVRVVDRIAGDKAGKAEVESVDCHDGRHIFVGTSDGHLLLYVIERRQDESGGEAFQSRLETRKNLNCGKKPVECVLCLVGSIHVFVLCDGMALAYDMRSLEAAAPAFPTPKGASLMTIDQRPPNAAQPRIGVAAKKKLYLYHYMRGQATTGKDYQLIKSGGSNTQEISLTDTPVALVWHGDTVGVAYSKQYVLISVTTGATRSLFSTEHPKVALHVLRREQEMLAFMDTIGVFFNFSGDPTRTSVSWPSAPDALGYLFPYIISLTDRGIVIKNVSDPNIGQRLPFVGGKFLSDLHDVVCVGTATGVFCLIPNPPEIQIAELIKLSRFTDALKLFGQYFSGDPEHARKLARLHEDIGFFLLLQRRWEEAFRHFNQSQVDPRDILVSFGDYLPAAQSAYRSKHQERLGASVTSDSLAILVRFLEGVRPKWTADPQVAQALDGALLRLYIDRGAPVQLQDKFLRAATELLTGSNSCPLNDSKTYLLSQEWCRTRHYLLGLLYACNENVDGALELWMKIGTGELPSDGTHDGIAPTVRCLAQSSNWERVQRYSDWLLKKKPEEGLKVFASKTRAEPFDDAVVLQFLLGYSRSLLYSYLEFIINERGVMTSDYHTQLAVYYVECVVAEVKAGIAPPTRPKLHGFLERSQSVSVPTLLPLCRDAKLYQETALLYSKMDQHQEALGILVTMVGDYAAAEAYCARHSTVRVGEDSMFVLLLKIYMNRNLVEPVISLLEHFPGEFEITRVLDLLPVELTLMKLSPFLVQAMRITLHRQRDESIRRNLVRAEHLQTKVTHIKVKKRGVTINKSRNCPICQKPIGDKVFAFYPNGTVVHFKCFKDKSICPVTGTDFRKFTAR